MNAREILARAGAAIGERQKTHGDPAVCFELASSLWSAHLETPVQVSDVPVLLALLKLARARAGDSGELDHWIDAASYAALAGELATKEREQ